MKLKSIIACGAILLTVGSATTSCEDMFTAENKLVSTDLTPQDTLYQVMGIVQRMQKLADRTVLLGELRADLVDVNSTASIDVQQLGNNDVSSSNIYNQPVDYYSVINSCNVYLANVDSLLKSHGEFYYEKEICGVKCFRAWCYLELAKIYGEVPFVTEPVLTADAAESIVTSGQKADIKTICDFLIEDLAKYPYMDKNAGLRPEYGNVSWISGKFSSFFIPVRALLGELYLWRGTFTGNREDYINAIRMYHDYFNFPGEEISTAMYSKTSYGRSYWENENFSEAKMSYATYSFGPSVSEQNAGVIPMDSISDLRSIFNSQYRNNYYSDVTPSERLRSISEGQNYCFHLYNNIVDTTYYAPHDKNLLPGGDRIYSGDLRFASVYTTESNLSVSQFNSALAPTKTFISKWLNGASFASGSDSRQQYVPYFRNNILYLHMAEALNRAGFPETAYAVLAYGLTYEVMNNTDIISNKEFMELCDIKSYGFSLIEPYYEEDLAKLANSSFVVWSSQKFENPQKLVNTWPRAVTLTRTTALPQVGIHQLGCGDTEYDETYYLDDKETLSNLRKLVLPVAPTEPTYNKKLDDADSTLYKAALVEYELAMEEYDRAMDKYMEDYEYNVEYLASPAVTAVRQAHIAKLILDEEALEGMFEGQRFYDIMRYQMQEGKMGTTITLPDYITTKYGPNATDRMTGKPWYLTLPKR